MPQELHVRFDPLDAGRFRVRLTDAAGADCGVPTEFEPFLSEADYGDLRWYLEEFMDLPDGGAMVRAAGVETRLTVWGRRLHDAVFGPPENRKQLDTLLADKIGPRELTIATAEAALLRLPWELMADDAGGLALRVSVRRQLPKPQKTAPRTSTSWLWAIFGSILRGMLWFLPRPKPVENTPHTVTLPLRLLYVVSRPGDTGFIDPRMTTKSLFTALDPLGASAQVDFCRPPTLARMQELLHQAQVAKAPYHVVHFDGHGTYDLTTQLGGLCFEKPDDGTGGASRTDLVSADRLGTLLAGYGIPLVVLEACRSATVGTAVFRSVAPRLIQSGVGSVLSMGHAVHVEAARVLLDRFYRELVLGATIGHAVAQGRAALVASPTRWLDHNPGGKTVTLADWFLPHLYQGGPDDVLFPADPVQQPVRPYDLFLSHNHGVAARVEALARELVGKHGLRVWLDGWECGPGELKPQCDAGIRDSRFTVVVGTQAALDSKWVAWEIAKHNEYNPEKDRLLPVKFEPLALPESLAGLLWVYCRDAARDADGAAQLTRHIRSTDAEDARRRRGFRTPPGAGEPGCFPRPPRYGFQGRARELHDLERSFRRHRGVVLHAMGGMGKTTLATEAAGWWTRSGLFRDGACFVSFEGFASADRVVQVFGNFCEGPKFDRRPAPEQRKRALEFFRDRDVLLVWDNYESVLPQFNTDVAKGESPYTDEERRRLNELFHDLTTGDGRGRVLVTCRPGKTDLPGAQKVELGGLARADSLWLLHRVLEKDGLALSDPRLAREKLDPLLDDLADHPLSLELVGPHLKTLTPEAIRADFGTLLAKFENAEADQGRNKSLLASLEFSRKHLSEAARSALPWLGLFRGGVFEDILLSVSEIESEAWEPIRRELQGIALLRVEDDIQVGERPFLRFHPTLASASAVNTLADQLETRARFSDAYTHLESVLGRALRGSQSREALEVLGREEANYRTAVRWSLAVGQHMTAAALGDTFRIYLERSSRLRERDSWVEWLREAVAGAGFTMGACELEMEHAWTLFTSGDAQGAVGRIRALVERLRGTKEFDPAFQLARANTTLGRILYYRGAPTSAIPILREAVAQWEALVEGTGGVAWEQLLATPTHTKAAARLGNLSVALGDLANALRQAGDYDAAITAAEKGLKIDEVQGNNQAVAAGHVQCARIHLEAGRYDQADARYELALAAARQTGDKGTEGTVLQHQGMLAGERNQHGRASRLYQQALQRYQEAGNLDGMMLTYNALGVTEQRVGRLAEARAWYERSRELAVKLRHDAGIGQAAQNIGIVYQEEGEVARARGDESDARRHFDTARGFVEEGLRIRQALNNVPLQADSLSQLARIYFLIGDLDAAARNAHAARKFRESLGLGTAWKDYHLLAEIADTRGDAVAAAEYGRKRDDLRGELNRRAGAVGVPAELLPALQQLAIACAKAGFGGGPLPSDAQENLTALDGFPAPLPAFAAHLREFAAGRTPPVPADLPAELRQLLEQLTQAVRDARGG